MYYNSDELLVTWWSREPISMQSGASGENSVSVIYVHVYLILNVNIDNIWIIIWDVDHDDSEREGLHNSQIERLFKEENWFFSQLHPSRLVFQSTTPIVLFLVRIYPIYLAVSPLCTRIFGPTCITRSSHYQVLSGIKALQWTLLYSTPCYTQHVYF